MLVTVNDRRYRDHHRVPALRFADAARRLGAAAHEAGLRVPAFRSPPRVAGAARTIRRYPRVPWCRSGSATAPSRRWWPTWSNIDMCQVVGALGRGLFRRVQRKADKCEAADFWKRRGGLSLRRHASTERFPAGDQRLAGRELCSGLHCGEDRCLRERRAIRAFGARLHVRELITKGGDLSRGKSVGDLEHERMVHPGPRTMGENITSGCSARRQIRRGHRVVGIDNDLERSAASRWH